MELHVVTITLISSRCNNTNNNEELYHVKIFCIYIALPLTTCATMKQEKLDQSLQQYIGQSVIQVQQQLNLTQMGYRQEQQPCKLKIHSLIPSCIICMVLSYACSY